MRGPVHLGKILEKTIISSGLDQESRERLRQGLKENKIFAVWEDSVGQTVALHTRPENIQRGYLTVFVSDSAWMQELQFLKSEIKKKLNRKLGRGTVRDIRFQIGAISAMQNSDRNTQAEQKEDAAGRLSVIDSGVLAKIDDQVRDINDPGVRESVRRYLIASSISSVETRKKRE